MAGKIFINYRRGDDPGFTQALYLRLEDEFTAGDLFMDVEGHIKPGDDFVEVLRRQVALSDVLLVVIGPRWGELLAARQADPDDFVAIEIKAALEQDKRVIPVLVGGAAMPRADSLPEAIRSLARRNAVGLRPERFKVDCQGLVAALKEQLAAAEVEKAARTDAERKAAEAARREQKDAAARRADEAEQRARAQSASGLSAEEVRKAEELANWQFVEGRNDIAELRDHLARFPSGVTEKYASTKLEGLAWAALGAAPGIEALKAYADEFPKGANAGAVRSKLAELEREAEAARIAEEERQRETATWGAVAVSTDKATIEAFLRDWPAGQHAASAKARLRELRRSAGGLSRGVLLGAGATAAVAALVAGSWLYYQQNRLNPMFWSVSTSVLSASAEQALKPKATFRECANCPDMVVVPAGAFMMGSLKGVGSDDERPQHKVTIAEPFAVSKFEVTFDEWDACVAHAGCPPVTADQGWGRGSRPAIMVSWDDAKRYVAWITKLTGKGYRLLSEAEWEYIARAGSTSKWSFGDDESKLGQYAWYYANAGGRTQPAGGKQPNDFGLYDMHGNVWEWVEDCYESNYSGAPDDGSVRTSTSCTSRVLRGGSWDNVPQYLRSALRYNYRPVNRFIVIGFRLARTL